MPKQPAKRVAEVRDVNAERDVHIGNKYITVVLQMPGYQPTPDLVALRTAYLEHLQRNYRALDFKGIPQLETLSRELLLEEVYVPVVARPELPVGETWERRLAGRTFDRDEIPDQAQMTLGKAAAPAASVHVEEAMRDQPRVVIIGDPGSGKSTLLKHLALRLTSEPNAPLPILVPLNAFADALAHADRNLQSYLPEYFAAVASALAGLAPLFEQALAQGQAVILLDGLDEVQADRARVVIKVEAFAREAAEKRNKIVVTSRIVGYRESQLNSKDWALYTLLDFDRYAIEQFANKWCLAFEKSTLGDTPEAHASAERERASLLEALGANPGVAKLAGNPLLLTILALIKRHGVMLPNHRVELYELYLKTLISAWSRARALDKRPVGPPLDYLQTIAVLGPLALWLREENPTAGLVSEERLIEWLTDFFKGEDWGLRQGEAMKQAREFLESVHKYSNLLLERGQGRYGFIHLTFEEALAARRLVQLGQLDISKSIDVIRQHVTDPVWRETILLAVGVWGLVREQPRVAGKVVRSILKMDCIDADAGKNVLLAGTALEDVGELGIGRAAANDVAEALLVAVQNRTLAPAVQREAGFILGRTGWVPPDLAAFVEIPAGKFLYGEEMKHLLIEHRYAIGKYPVTNLQFKRFIEADGYNRREFWSDEGWAWRTTQKRSEPIDWHDVKWNNPLAPVVGVSWFEAESYCLWLTRELGMPIRLPSEEEWERAARHIDGREYPWGNEFDLNRLNCLDFWVGEYMPSATHRGIHPPEAEAHELASPTVVVQFVEGNSVAGLSDMSGNVWEWSADKNDKGNRVVRGGSWYMLGELGRCAYRTARHGSDSYDDVGFRVLSPRS
jgi:formylglycine-generating enzyme required for sulfatase activity/energy-coupling factor transporter ATP-binding protein EcfA2